MTTAGFESRPPDDRPEQAPGLPLYRPIGIEKIEDIERKLRLPVLGSIERHDKRNSLQFTKAIAAIWHKAQKGEPSGSRKVIQFTSAGGGEGKTNISAAFAAAAAHSGQKVLLIDGSLRHISRGGRGTLSEIVGLGQTAGLQELLLGAADFGDVARYRADTHCIVISAGNLAMLENDGNQQVELLSSSRAKGLFDTARRLFDYIVVDAPPMLLIDPVIISEYCDQAIFVAKASTPMQEILYAVKRLARYKPASGIVLNLNQPASNPDGSARPE